MNPLPHPQTLLDALAKFDTPTICNALELIEPAYRNQGFTSEPLQCIYPDLPPMVGLDRNGEITNAAVEFAHR